MIKKPAEMTAADVVVFVQQAIQHQIEIWLDGGWGVDALLDEQTRPHGDLDIMINQMHVPQLRALLEAQGYRNLPRDDTRDCNFVLGDDDGHQIDVHAFMLDKNGNSTYDGKDFPLDSLTGTGSINGYIVKCISPEWMIKFHTGYALDEKDYRDVQALCQRFNLPLPDDYKIFATPTEIGGPQGPEPTRYGDWEVGGRCSDF